MPSGRIPKHQKPIYCPTCNCNTLQPPDIGCVVCAARAAKPGPMRLRPGDLRAAKPHLSLEQICEMYKLRKRHIKEKKAVCGGNSPGPAAIFLHAIRRDRRRRIFPQH